VLVIKWVRPVQGGFEAVGSVHETIIRCVNSELNLRVEWGEG
jgi:hypothetical protein